MTSPRTLGTVRSYADLLGVMRARASELGLSRLELDRLAKLQSGYAGKLLAPRPAKRLGMRTMGPVLAALGIQLVAVADESGAQGDSRGLDKPMLRNAVHYSLSRRFLSKIGRKGNQAKMWMLTRQDRRRIARNAARTRWERVRAKAS